MPSQAERDIREAVVAKLHAEVPSARVIHELVCGVNRADVAAVDRERVILFEIKSERDVLARMEKQLDSFRQHGHAAVLVAHEKWFDKTPYTNGLPRLAWLHARHSHVWCYPEPEPSSSGHLYRWELPRHGLAQPHARRLLDLLWRAELLEEARRHRIAVTSRSTCESMISDMAYLMTGREIAQAACRQLRARAFPEADAPIFERAAA